MDHIELFDSKAKVEVNNIVVSGNDRTKLSFFSSELSGAINTSNNLEELHRNLLSTTDRLLQKNLFDLVDTNIDIHSLSGDKYSATIKVNVKEKGIPFLKAQSYVKSGNSSDVGFELEGALRSPTGHGEVIRISSITSPGGMQEYNTSLSIPNVSDDLGTLDISARSGLENQSYFTSFKQSTNAVRVDYTSRNNKHNVTAEYSLRDEIPNQSTPSSVSTSTTALARSASVPTLASATSSIKTSLKYAFTAVDTRNSAANPSTGQLLQGSVEVAFPPGGAQFIKKELTAQVHHTFNFGGKQQVYPNTPGLVGSLCGSVGFIYPLMKLLPSTAGANKQYKSYLTDRFQLGGPLSLRGFDNSGTGRRAYTHGNATSAGNAAAGLGDSLGGDTKTSVLACLSVPVPVPNLATSGVRAFVFFNAGSLGNSPYWSTVGTSAATKSTTGAASGTTTCEKKNSCLPAFGALRASVGGGLSFAFNDQVRLETTYSVPILKAKQDNVKGFQIGVGLSIN